MPSESAATEHSNNDEGIMHLVLTRNLILDHCAAAPGHATLLDSLQARANANGDTLWIHMAIIGDLLDRATAEVMRTQSALGATHAREYARARIEPLLDQCQLLASLADEAPAALQANAEIAMALRAAQRLGPQARVLAPRAECTLDPLCMPPEDYLAAHAMPKPIPFIDLERQQHALRTGLEPALHRVLHHGQYILGPEISALECELANYVGVRHAITVASGTDALLIALMALNIEPGDEVITTPYTWISTAEVIALLRAKPVFVDIEWETMNIDPAAIPRAITSRTRAIMPVGIYGQCADMTAINRIADAAGIPVIEDAAQCFGATHHGVRSCALSRIGCTSFFPSKPLGCYGDGGAIFTNDDALADTMRQIRVHGQKVKHQHPIVGINGRMDTLQAAIVLEKLRIFDKECRLRNEVAARYDAMLAPLPGITTPKIAKGNTSVYAQYTIRLNDPDAASARLQKAGIPSVGYYRVPLHLQGAFASLGYKKGDFPIAEKVASQGLSLPMSPHITAAEQQRVVEALAHE
jgi:UDP-2-acetamido-2-deoxy-ribo-hexuluronate aminotransferase